MPARLTRHFALLTSGGASGDASADVGGQTLTVSPLAPTLRTDQIVAVNLQTVTLSSFAATAATVTIATAGLQTLTASMLAATATGGAVVAETQQTVTVSTLAPDVVIIGGGGIPGSATTVGVQW